MAHGPPDRAGPFEKPAEDPAETSGTRRAEEPSSTADAVAAYKSFMRDVLDRRPSGTRQKLAEAFGTHKSFVSQVTNPTYRVPLPAQHVPALFRVCRFSPDEQKHFLELYAKAHPTQSRSIDELAAIDADVLHIPLPKSLPARQRAELEDLLREFAERVVALMQNAK